MAYTTRVLVYGNDQNLLDSRRLLLEHSGFEVRTTSNLDEVTRASNSHGLDVLILCHTLSEKECVSALSALHTYAPEVHEVALSSATPPCKIDPQGKIVDVFDGPAALLSAVGKLTPVASHI